MAKRIVICADGTWNKPEQTDQGTSRSTNVVKIVTAVRPQDSKGMTQVVYYHKGVGERGGLWDRLTGGAFGAGISQNIEDIYLFLISNYAPGDELFLLGFSRGAYTARSVAGFIRNSGILKPEFLSKYREAHDLYRDRSDASHPRSEQAVNFRNQYAWPDFNIRFIGVWDTVGALGIPVMPVRFWTKKRYEFHDVELSSHVDYAYQALAIDERRKPFLPAVWKRQPSAIETQVLEQAWFPGVHCDVGGGYPITGLSDGALLWMCDRAAKCSLDLDTNKFPAAGDPKAQIGDSMTLFYRVLGNGTRRLGATNPLGEEGLHQSTMARTTQDPSYQPQNLNVFKAQKPDIYGP
jgi:uncharacterized protein (DUF2235 family)